MSAPTDLVPGQELHHYRILALLGQGGMGEVYLAEDQKLNRQVALKLLPAAWTGDPDRVRRFAQEARAASALSHPNIVTVFEVGEHAERHFLAMEYVAGSTLRQLIEQRGKLDLATALDVTAQVARALIAAHQAGVIHRDIKPENIMLRPDGYVKVLDFGLAKLTEARRAERGEQIEEVATLSLPDPGNPSAVNHQSQSTAPGVVMGTVSYMSPEQARGQKVDARTDLFSLGVVLFELLTGQLPFKGETPSDVLAAILRAEPAALQDSNPGTPAALQNIVNRTLCKDRELRCQTAVELLQVLHKLKQRVEWESEHATPYNSAEHENQTNGGPTSVPTQSSAEYLVKQIQRQIKLHKRALIGGLLLLLLMTALSYYFWQRQSVALDSVAVLPFVNASNDPNYEYLSDGIADSIINRLAQLDGLKVLSLSAVSRYRGQTPDAPVDARVVGQELNVGVVLTGRLRQAGDILTINAELVDTRDRRRLWGQQYTRQVADLLAVQEELAREISEQLRPRLSNAEQRRLQRHATDNAAAYQLYLKGRHQWNKRSALGLNAAIGFFNQAIELDPGYALAWTGLADCYGLLSNYTSTPAAEAMPRARAAAQKALDMDESLAEAHTALGLVKRDYEWDFAGAEAEFRRALALNPNYATAWQFHAENLVRLKKLDEALSAMQRAQELDPFSLIINGEVGWVYYQAQRYDEAVVQLRKTAALDPNFARTHFFLGRVYEQQRLYVEAQAATQEALRLSNGYVLFQASLGHIQAQAGRRAEAQQTLAELRQRATREYVSPFALALVETGLGNRDEAFAWLEKAYAARDSILVNYLRDPQLAGLRDDARYQTLCQRLNLMQ